MLHFNNFFLFLYHVVLAEECNIKYSKNNIMFFNNPISHFF